MSPRSPKRLRPTRQSSYRASTRARAAGCCTGGTGLVGTWPANCSVIDRHPSGAAAVMDCGMNITARDLNILRLLRRYFYLRRAQIGERVAPHDADLRAAQVEIAAQEPE